MKNFHIYKITSPTGKIYIGKTTNINERIKFYKYSKCEKQPLICKSLKKYGFKNHNFEIIHEGSNTLEEINKLEIHYIFINESFNGNNKNGLNLTLGGDGGLGKKISEEHKKKIIEFNKNRVYKKHTEETKKLISENRKKTGSTIAHKEAMKKLIGRKINKSEDWIKNNSESIKKPIIQFDMNNNFIKEWKSAKDVELELGFCRKNISANLRNKSKHAYQYVWKFK